MLHLIGSTLRTQNDSPYFLIATNPVEVHHVDVEARVADLIHADVEY